jgi:hypothetical protein
MAFAAAWLATLSRQDAVPEMQSGMVQTHEELTIESNDIFTMGKYICIYTITATFSSVGLQNCWETCWHHLFSWRRPAVHPATSRLDWSPTLQ